MGLITRVLDNLEERRQKVLTGGINCIPSPFVSFRRDFPGIEQGKYVLVSGSSKSGKSQVTNYLFLYTPILYAYEHPDQVRVNIFYFPFEETPENITLRFMSYLLYTMSGMKIRISPMDLKSTDADHVLDQSILDILKSSEYQSILQFYEEHVHFLSDRNATGIYKTVERYAQEAGTVHRKTIIIENKETGVKQEKEVFDYYEPKDPDEYVIIICDHASIQTPERGMDLRESINKLSEYMMVFRNKYHYTPVLVQQQGQETTSLEAFKEKKITPSLVGCADSRNPPKDVNLMLGITNPYSFEIPRFPDNSQGYDITKLRGNARFLNVVLNRDGESNGMLALYFDGATNFFTPLPKSTDLHNMNKVYDLIKRNESTRT